MILFSNTEEILDEHKNFKEKLDNATHMLEIDMNYSLGNLFIQMVKLNYYLPLKILEKVASPEVFRTLGLLPLRSEKSGRFEKLLGFARGHSILSHLLSLILMILELRSAGLSCSNFI